LKLTKNERAYMARAEAMGYSVKMSTLKTTGHIGRGGKLHEFVTGTWERIAPKRISRKKARKIAYNKRVGA
jgi:hypothetical protein